MWCISFLKIRAESFFCLTNMKSTHLYRDIAFYFLFRYLPGKAKRTLLWIEWLGCQGFSCDACLVTEEMKPSCWCILASWYTGCHLPQQKISAGEKRCNNDSKAIKNILGMGKPLVSFRLMTWKCLAAPQTPPKVRDHWAAKHFSTNSVWSWSSKY